jgi:hypothetical protein
MSKSKPSVLRNLFTLVRAFLKDFYTESKRGTIQHAKGVIIFLSFAALCVLAVVAAAYKISEQPFFCGVCHNMKVYVSSWKASKHRSVACIECHYKPGFINHLKGKWKDGQISLVYFVTGKTITKPHAEIDDASCLQRGCHKRERLYKEIVFKNVVFSHAQHLGQMKRQKQLRCTTCHSQIVQGAHITVTDVECFICHFYKTKGQKEYVAGCTACHFEAKGDIKVPGSFDFNHRRYIKRGVKCEVCHTNVVTGDGHIQENACLQCHNKRRILEASFTPEVLHRNHVTDHKVECFTCHSAIKHKITRPHTRDVQAGECARCHTADTHDEKVYLYAGKGANLIQDMPDRKSLLNMDCSACHQQGKSGADLQERCKECHGTLADGMVPRWKAFVKGREEELQKEIAAISAGEKGHNKALDSVLYNQSYVAKGRAVHNFLYIAAVLDRSRNALLQLKGTERKPDPKSPRVAISCTAMCHGNVGDRKVKFGAVFFPHSMHGDDEASCSNCHTPYEDHGKTLYKGCSECHHGQGAGKVSCQDCHRQEAALIKTKGSTHAAAGCTDCHTGVRQGKRDSTAKIKKSCAACHGKGHDKTVDEWLSREQEIGSWFAKDKAALEKQIEAIEGKEGKHSVPLRKVYDEMSDNMGTLIAGKYAHNPAYSEVLLSNTQQNLQALRQMIKDKQEGKVIVIR